MLSLSSHATCRMTKLHKRIQRRLHHLKHFGIEVTVRGRHYYLQDANTTKPIRVTINNPNFYKKLIWRGSLGIAEGYIAQDWQCDTLTELLCLFARHDELMQRLEGGRSWFGQCWRAIRTGLSYNHIRKSRRNIMRHYDLSNELFELLLDKSMMYSSAVYPHAGADLDSAQRHKCHLIANALAVTADDHVLEIGTGWGGFAIFLAQHYGCRVTTTTISRAQYEYAARRIAQCGLTDRITLLQQDYRTLTGQYDKVVSIEMIEAVGHQYFEHYFKQCDQRLKPGGRFVLQCITIKDDRYEAYKHTIDFIKAYIFPGGCLPSLALMQRITQQKTQLTLVAQRQLGQDYATTVLQWRDHLLKKQQAILALGFDARFIRLFDYYFCYCAAGFLGEHINTLQLTFTKA